ncbi:MAG: pilus assembly protein N-terminal domain-containing protein [Alphaproteobacteria bacterium]|nr:pilus assembly protein N-terminal domain-containing protein [Alphaproteobacteria bacterium]
MVTRFISIAIVLVALTFSAVAADSTAVPLGGSILLRLPRNAVHVVVGNPVIADISMQSPRDLILFGKYPGGTTLLVTDKAGSIILQSSLMVTASSPSGVTIRYGMGKNWVPGGAIASAECGQDRCSPAIALPSEAVYKPGSGNVSPMPAMSSIAGK